MRSTRRGSRAPSTAWLVLTPLDSLWVSIHKSWRLNERMYGALTGLSKMIAQRMERPSSGSGAAGLRKDHRREVAVQLKYPGNDERYVKYTSTTCLLV